MAEVVNLRLARKAKKREASSIRAAENRAKFGRTKAERDASEAEIARLHRDLDGTRRPT